MHPLELQIKDLKEQLEAKNRKIKEIIAGLTEMSKCIEELRDMLHPSRQSAAEHIKTKLETIRKIQ